MTQRKTISGAVSGEKATLAGTEKFPIDGNQYGLVSSVATYTRTVANCFAIPAGFASTNPADATTYYFGAFPHVALSTTAANQRLYIMRAGTVVAADIFMICTTGTSETSTMSFRLNNTTDTTISSAVALNATPFHVQNTSLSIAVAAGDYFEIKWVTPTWVTNPTAVLGWVQIFVR
jgi:hypothetical protein